MRRRARERLEDFELTEDGSYAYTGALWGWESAEACTSFLRRSRAMLAAAALCLLAIGFVPVSGLGETFIVLVPYLVAIGVLLLALGDVLKLSHEGEQIRDHVRASSFDGLATKLTVGLIAAIACSLGQLVCLVSGMGEVSNRPLALFALACMLGCSASYALLLRSVRSLELRKLQ